MLTNFNLFKSRGSGVFHRGSAANYKRIIYVKTMEFKDVTIMDKVRISGQYRQRSERSWKSVAIVRTPHISVGNLTAPVFYNAGGWGAQSLRGQNPCT